jgi:CRP/FNR family transcriptional regulator
MSSKPAAISILRAAPAPACESCRVRKLCLPVSLDHAQIGLMDEVLKKRNGLKSGEYIYRAGDRFRSLYAIKSGAVKTYGLTTDGKEQITGFHLSGELLGMDAISNNVHNCNAVALEGTEVCELPFEELESLGQRLPTLQHEISRVMSREIYEESAMLIMIGKMNAEERVACFLQNLYHRIRQRGGELDAMRLPMSREDIGNYLGLTLETVSRRLSIMQGQGIIRIDKRKISILDMAALSRLCTS